MVASTGFGTASIGDMPSGAGYYAYGEGGAVQTLELDLGIRVGGSWMVGLHGGAASATTFISGWSDFMGTDEHHYAVRTMQYGITAQHAFANRTWVAPWLGVQDAMTRHECSGYDNTYPYQTAPPCTPTNDAWKHHFDPKPAIGVTAGFDLLQHAGHRLSLVGAIVVGIVNPDASTGGAASYSSFSLGLAYRFWR